MYLFSYSESYAQVRVGLLLLAADEWVLLCRRLDEPGAFGEATTTT